ncbi:auxin response factor 4 [Dorcoceras hygrometricum]|uniref:Auxin response factor n=1 Tax=Dorcoceras hygrometricum TaxID=472368 RepID=A0A2Z7CJV6_9LAMI|nr:auxin response factor 4 [Dorcoceras hygrometricum]
MESPAFDLPPQIFCRVVDVQLLANKENDEVYSQLTLLPLRELVGLELGGTENGNEGVDEDGNVAGALKSTSHMFCKTLTASDTSTHGGFSVPRRAAEDCFPPLDYKEQRPSQELIAKDLHGVEWKFRHIYRGQPRRHLLTTGWSIFVSQKNLASGDAVLFLRASHADFIVPYQKYFKCTTSQIHVGTRFKMKFDLDDSPERRFSGVVIGVGDMDPYRWPNSKWRNLMVRWDDDIVSNHQDRVSPWVIEFSGVSSRLDFEESVKSSKVLQGQENLAFVSPLCRNNRISRHLDFETRPPASNPILDRMDKSNHTKFLRNPAPTTFTSFLQSNWLPEVLQGQEICSLRSLSGKTDANLSVGSKPELGFNALNAYQRPQLSFYPLASEGARKLLLDKSNYRVRHGPLMVSNFQRGTSVLNPNPALFKDIGDVGRMPYLGNELRAVEQTSPPPTSLMHLKNLDDDNYLKDKVPPCKLFGFSLTDDLDAVNSQGPSKRSCTKVHKQGSLVARAIDLSKLVGYEDLLTALERLFSMEGLLRDPNNGWHILYTDSENDMMVVGDDPWKRLGRFMGTYADSSATPPRLADQLFQCVRGRLG